VPRFDQVPGGDETGETGPDHDGVIEIGFTHAQIVTR